MKKPFLLFFILILVCSCSGHQDIKALLSRSEFLMSEYPDSSYTLLRSINTNHLFNRGKKAKYSLLMTEAQYKNYEVFENDSLINIAIKYYEKNGERRYYGRSLMYRGAVLYDMMDYNGAMESYKKAEEVMEPLDEYLTLGLINTRIAQLYEHLYLSDNMVIDRDKKAAYFFNKANDIVRESNAYSSVASSYVFSSEIDSALFYLDKSIKISQEIRDTTMLLYNYYLLTQLNMENSEYKKAVEVASNVIRNYSGYDDMFLYNLSVSFARLNQIDSAYYYYHKIDNPKKQILLNYVTLAVIEECAGNYKEALNYNIKTQEISDSLYNDRNRQNVLLIEKQFDYQNVVHQNQIIENRNTIRMIIGVSVSFVAISLLAIILVVAKKRNKRELSSMLSFIEQLKGESDIAQNKFISELSHKDKTEVKLRAILEEKLAILAHLAGISYQYSSGRTKNSRDALLKEYNKVINVGRLSEGVFKDICEIVNIQHSGVIECIRRGYPFLRDDDLYFISLLCCEFSTPTICAFYGYTSQEAVYVRKSRLSKRMKLETSMEEYIKGVESSCKKT